jgi:hypothetical protein
VLGSGKGLRALPDAPGIYVKSAAQPRRAAG